jgi:putative MATE family efflux protein
MSRHHPPHAERPPLPTPRMLPLVGPLLAELLLGMTMGLVGTILAARLGDAQGAAFALCSQVLAMLFVFFRIVGAGVSVVVSQALGGNRPDEAERCARATLGASTWIGGICTVLAVLGAEPMLRAMNAPAAVMPLAVPFLQCIAPAALFDAWNTTLASVLRAHMRARATLVFNGVMQGSHLLLAIVLMSGFGSWHGWGLIGYAVALLISRAFGLGLLLWMWRTYLGLLPRWHDWWAWQRHTLAPVLHIGMPGAAENVAWRAGFMFSVAMVGQMGTAALATHAYTMQIIHLIMLFGLATGLSAEVVVGHMIGAGRLHQAHRLVRRALVRGLSVTVVVALAAALSGPWLLGHFTQDATIIAAGATLMWLNLALETGRTFNLLLVNVLRAAGDARYPLVMGIASFVLVLGGGSWFFGIHLGWGLAGVWVAYAADEWLRGLISWHRWVTLGWVPTARQMHRRLRQSPAVHTP